MEKRTEFPALEARKAYLQQAHYDAQRQANDAAYSGKIEGGVLHWLAGIREELDELTYALRILADNGDKIEFRRNTLRVGVFLFVIVVLAQIVILQWLSAQ